MKILIGEKGEVDFDAPVNMSKEQFDRFVEFFKDLNFEVEVEKRVDVEKVQGERERNPKKWTLDDYLVLITPMPLEEKKKKLGRSSMGIWMKMAEIIPKFSSWALEKGVKPPYSPTTIDRFLNESGLK
ncbi:MAG: hypothetical protein V1847_01645 [Candidatus Diapherotrites archaeon]